MARTSLRFSFVGLAALVAALPLAQACTGSRRGRSILPPRSDGGTLPLGTDAGPSSSGTLVDEGLAVARALLDELCPCMVESGDYTTVDECLADNTSTADYARCSRELYASMRGAELDAALRCQLDQARTFTGCVRSMGCSGFGACIPDASACPMSAAFTAYDDAVTACARGTMSPPPSTCMPRSTAGGTGMALFTGTTGGGSSMLSGSCGGGSAPDAVHEWVAAAAGTVTFDTVGSDFDTVLYVLDGGCTGMELACNDDTMSVQSEVTVTVSAGQHLFVVIDGFSNNAGSYVVNVR